jgi:hypothetical protein
LNKSPRLGAILSVTKFLTIAFNLNTLCCAT